MSETHGKVWWSELMTRDVKGAVDYYTKICGWSFEATPMPDGSTYWVASLGGAPVAGVMDMADIPDSADIPPHWMTYLAVDDVDAALEATKAAGGQVLRPAFDVEMAGRIGLITDPTGAALGLMTPAPMPEG